MKTMNQHATATLTRTCALAFTLLLALAVSAQAEGPTSTLFLTAGDPVGVNAWIPGGTRIARIAAQAYGREYAIAVSGGTIRTAHNVNYPGSGATYNLNFTYTGPALPAVADEIYDGTTDGTYNYAVSYALGTVIRYDLNWGSPTTLFTVTGASPIGISYDTSDSSLWVSDFYSGVVRNWTLSGTLVSSFDTGLGRAFSLAFDPADQTLWMMSAQASSVIRQFSRDGTLLQTINFQNYANYLGAEFAIPEPHSMLLVFLGCFLLLGRKSAQSA